MTGYEVIRSVVREEVLNPGVVSVPHEPQNEVPHNPHNLLRSPF